MRPIIEQPQRIRGRALQARRARVWKRHPYCAMCGCLTAFPSGFELDHIQSLYREGEDTEDNTQILCLVCHPLKTANDLGYSLTAKFDDDGNVKW